MGRIRLEDSHILEPVSREEKDAVEKQKANEKGKWLVATRRGERVG